MVVLPQTAALPVDLFGSQSLNDDELQRSFKDLQDSL